MAIDEHGRRGFIKNAGLVAGSVLGANILPAQAVAQSVPTSTVFATKGAQLRALLAKTEPIITPIIPDILSARLCELEGFTAVFIGDSQSTRWHGVPSFGLISMTELVGYAVHVAEHTNLPVIADLEDGGGSPLKIYRATQQLERGNVAAAMYEDRPPESNLVRNGPLVSKDQMVDKIKAAVDARRDQSLVIVARTHAQNHGYTMEQALDRGLACADAGADVIFFSGMRLQDHPKAQEIVKKPLLTLGTARTTPQQAKAAKLSVVIYHLDNVGHGAIHQALKELKTTGTFENSSKLSLPGAVHEQLVRSQDYVALARKYHMVP